MATDEDLPGTFNVAADDMVTLTQALRMMGRPSVGVPQPLAPIVAVWADRPGCVTFPPTRSTP